MTPAFLGAHATPSECIGRNDDYIEHISIGKLADFAVWQCDSPEVVVYNLTDKLCCAIIKNGVLFTSH